MTNSIFYVVIIDRQGNAYATKMTHSQIENAIIRGEWNIQAFAKSNRANFLRHASQYGLYDEAERIAS